MSHERRRICEFAGENSHHVEGALVTNWWSNLDKLRAYSASIIILLRTPVKLVFFDVYYRSSRFQSRRRFIILLPNLIAPLVTPALERYGRRKCMPLSFLSIPSPFLSAALGPLLLSVRDGFAPIDGRRHAHSASLSSAFRERG